ncbi:MAG: 4Fe-4S binding protein [Candidatus Zixiibacteriota bacterium]
MTSDIPGMESKVATRRQIPVGVQLRRRHERNSAQPFRFYAQLFSLAINLWIGAQFYLWYSSLQSGVGGPIVSRPPGVEGWLPIGSLVGSRYFFATGILNTIHPAGLVILVVILLTAFVFKKGFCSWVCPIGFISEMLGDLSDKLFRKRIKPPRWLDYPLRSLKYLLLLFFVYAVFISMTSDSIKAFLYSDYNVVSDILMLRFFTDISMFALSVIAVLFASSLIVRGFWCRYLCPYGALLGLANLISPTRIRRNASSCIDCAACAKVCPAFIKVDRVTEVVSDECVGCMACVDSCPVKQTLEIHMVRKNRTVSSVKWAVVLVIFFWGALLAAKLFGPWGNSITTEQYREYIPGVEKGQYTHPSY